MTVLCYRALLAIPALAALSVLSFAQSAASCDSQAVRYTAIDPQLAKQIRVVRLESPFPKPADSEKQLSPQGTSWFVKIDSDFTKPGPWKSTVLVSARSNRKAFRLSLVNVSTNVPDVKWLNEKLLFVQVFWGRITSTDMVFDTDKGQFIYKEMASYGEIMGPCQ